MEAENRIMDLGIMSLPLIGYSSKTMIIEELNNLFSWGTSERERGRDVTTYTVSGEACPTIWNGLSATLPRMLRTGVRFEHIFGPVLAVASGYNLILKNYIDYPDVVKYHMLWTRYPDHCVLVSSVGVEQEDIRFKLRLEESHEPLAKDRWAGGIELLSSSDPERRKKLGIYFDKRREFEALKFGTNRVESVRDIICMEYDDLKMVKRQARDKGTYFEALDAESILALKDSA